MIVNFFIGQREVAGCEIDAIPRIGDTIDFYPDKLQVNNVEWVLAPGEKPYVNVYTNQADNEVGLHLV